MKRWALDRSALNTKNWVPDRFLKFINRSKTDSRLFPHCTTSLHGKNYYSMFFNKSPDNLVLKSNNYNHTKNRYNVSHKLYFLPCFPPEKSPFVKIRSFHTMSMSTMLYRSPRLQQGHRRTVKSPGSAESPTSPFYYGRSHCNSPIFHYMIK